MRYVVSRWNQEQQRHAYRIYVTDALKVIAENTARVNGGSTLSERYCNVIKKPVNDNRTKEDIIESIKAKLANGGD